MVFALNGAPLELGVLEDVGDDVDGLWDVSLGQNGMEQRQAIVREFKSNAHTSLSNFPPITPPEMKSLERIVVTVW
jgi:hypothetical protein